LTSGDIYDLKKVYHKKKAQGGEVMNGCIGHVEECPNLLECEKCGLADRCCLYPYAEHERQPGMKQCPVFGPVGGDRCDRCRTSQGYCRAETGKLVYRRIPYYEGCDEQGAPALLKGAIPDCCVENMDLFARLVHEGEQGMLCILGCHRIYVQRSEPGNLMILELSKGKSLSGPDLKRKRKC